MLQRLEVIDFTRILYFYHCADAFVAKLSDTSVFNGCFIFWWSRSTCICSGFGLYLSYLNKPLTYSQFLKRRFLKVYLPYIIIILVSALIPFIILHQINFSKYLVIYFSLKCFLMIWRILLEGRCGLFQQ